MRLHTRSSLLLTQRELLEIEDLQQQLAEMKALLEERNSADGTVSANVSYIDNVNDSNKMDINTTSGRS